jgi:3-methylcrotonyl-CoA carboxylase beta subunit
VAILRSNSTIQGAELEANRSAWTALAEDLSQKRAEAARGGNDRARERHLSRGKLLPRERVTRLLDPGTPFLELGALAAHGMYDDAIRWRGPDHRHRPRLGPRGA